MGMIVKEFRAFLIAPVDGESKYLPLPPSAVEDLTTMLLDAGSYIYLSVRSDRSFETVKAQVTEGRLWFERGVADTQACGHHPGSAVTSVSPTVVQVIKELCNA